MFQKDLDALIVMDMDIFLEIVPKKKELVRIKVHTVIMGVSNLPLYGPSTDLKWTALEFP